MANLMQIDMSDAQELGAGFRVVPPGEYQVYIESSDFKKTKSGTGEFLELVLVVGDGEYEGAKIIVRLNLINSNQIAVDIAKSQLRALCEAIVGQPFVNDSAMLHSRLFFALVDNVAMNKDDQNSKRSNEVIFRKGSIRSINSASVVKPVVAAPVAMAQPVQQAAPDPVVTPGTGKPPWKK